MLDKSSINDEFVSFDILPIVKSCATLFMDDVINNLFFTTQFLRDYHYQKQKNNAFYHIQAINLPFQNIEFFWIK